MSSSYYYQQHGKIFGPVNAKALRELAAVGKLKATDLIQREGTDGWAPASKYKNLFSSDSPSAMEPAPPMASDDSVPSPHALISPPRPSRLQDWSDRLRPIAQRHAQEFGLETHHFLAAFAGAACLLLLLLSTFMTWDVYVIQAGSAMKGIGDSKATAGLEVPEGKWVAFLSVAGIGFVAATYFVKRLLRLSLLVAGASATCSLLLACSFNHQLRHFNAESERVAKALGKNLGQEAAELLVGSEFESAGIGLYLVFLASLVAAPALIYVGFKNPLPVAYLQKESIHPAARTHGALLIAQAVAVVVGLGVFIARY